MANVGGAVGVAEGCVACQDVIEVAGCAGDVKREGLRGC